jgi:hypothetical protein
MKIAIGGKGGVGKTTVCSVWAQLFAEEGHDVLAIDADPSLSLGAAFGLPAQSTPRPLIEMKDLIAERTGTRKDAVGAYFRLNPTVSDLPEEHWLKVGNVKLLVLEAVTQAGGGYAARRGFSGPGPHDFSRMSWFWSIWRQVWVLGGPASGRRLWWLWAGQPQYRCREHRAAAGTGDRRGRAIANK